MLVPTFARSFRTQTALAFGLIVIALAIALSAVMGQMLTSRIRLDKGSALQLVARHAARTLSSGLQERSREVQVLANSPSLWAEGLGSADVTHTLARTQATRAFSAWIGVADTQGTVQSATGGLLVGASVSERPWFKDGLHGVHVGDVHPAKLLASLLPNTDSNEPRRFVDFSAPITVGGRVLGVLGSHGSWEWTGTVVNSLLPSNAAELGLQVLIYDRAGRLIYHPEGEAGIARVGALPEAIPAANSTASVLHWPGDQDYLTASATLDASGQPTDLGWRVVARQPVSTAFASARKAANLTLQIGALAAAIAMALAWRVSGQLSAPLARIAQAARDVEQGKPDARIPYVIGNRELEGLSAALSGMTTRLVAHGIELEARVEDRTRDLQIANEGLAILASHDPLTGVLNRRAFDERLKQSLAESKRSGCPVSMLMIDADHFKNVNDRYGHDGGDNALVMIGQVLKRRLREADACARMGGEEFAVLLPDTDAEGARQVAESLRQQIAGATVYGVGHITVSIGVATGRYARGMQAALMKEADRALYRAKADGRNRVVGHTVDADAVGLPPGADLTA